MRTASFIAVACGIGLAACGDGSWPTSHSYVLRDGEPGRLEFLLGRAEIVDRLPEIRAGGGLHEKWTLVSISPEVIAPDALVGDLDLSSAGVRISHEFDGQDPHAGDEGVAWIRFDFDTVPGTTTGRLAFDRRPGEDNGVSLEAIFEGHVDLDGRGASYFKLELFTGFPFAEP